MNKCPLCQSKKSEDFLKVNTYLILRCVSCQLIYTNINSLTGYNKFNIRHYTKNYLKGYITNESVQKRLLANLKYIENFTNGGKLLDAGCGSGSLLRTVGLRSKHDWQLFGIDINNFLALTASRASGAKVQNKSLSKADYQNEYFDCITCFDTLEHDFNIEKNLLNLKRMLKKDGILIVQVPNHQSLMAYILGKHWDWWSPPDHLIHFSAETLGKILTSLEFKIIDIKTYEPLQDFLSNIKGALFKTKILKIFYYVLIPIFATLRLFADMFGYGALALFVVKK